MKKIILSLAAMTLVMLSNQAQAQTEKKKEIQKEVKMVEDDGVKTLTIKTTENGKTTTEIYKGEDAEKKMNELHKVKNGSTKSMVIGKDGKKRMKVEKRIVIKEETKEEQ